MNRRSIARLAIVFAVALAAAAAWACQTPVYRYALLNWPTRSYYIFYFHHGPIAADDEKLNKKIIDLAEVAEGPVANVRLTAIDADKGSLDRLPREVVDAWREKDNGKSGTYLLYTTWGSKLHVGRLDEATVRAMVDSPARKRIGELLKQGNAVVWIMLNGSDESANAAAAKVLDQIVADCKSGKIVSPPDDVGAMPSPPAGGTDDAGAAGSPKPSPSDMLSVAVVKVKADDPAEKWFVAALETIEPLYDDSQRDDPDARPESVAPPPTSPHDAPPPAAAGEAHPPKPAASASPTGKAATASAPRSAANNGPRVYAVYGRGRVMQPYTDPHITVDDLTQCLAFLSGPCSCVLKDDNPGVDLLMTWDWDATATALEAAAEQAQLGALGYQEVSPTAKPATPGDKTKPAATPGANPVTTTDTVAPPAKTVPAAAAGDPSGSTEFEADAAAGDPSSVDGDTSFARRQSWHFTLGLVIVGATVLTIGVVLLAWQGRMR